MDGSPPGSTPLGFSRQEHWSGLPFPSPMLESEKWKWSHWTCPTLSDPMDCSPPGSSVHGIFQARVLEWGAIAFSCEQDWIAFFKFSMPSFASIICPFPPLAPTLFLENCYLSVYDANLKQWTLFSTFPQSLEVEWITLPSDSFGVPYNPVSTQQTEVLYRVSLITPAPLKKKRKIPKRKKKKKGSCVSKTHYSRIKIDLPHTFPPLILNGFFLWITSESWGWCLLHYPPGSSLISDTGGVFPLSSPLGSHQLLHLTIISLIWIPGMALRGLSLTYTLAYSHYGAYFTDL